MAVNQYLGVRLKEDMRGFTGRAELLVAWHARQTNDASLLVIIL